MISSGLSCSPLPAEDMTPAPLATEPVKVVLGAKRLKMRRPQRINLWLMSYAISGGSLAKFPRAAKRLQDS